MRRSLCEQLESVWEEGEELARSTPLDTHHYTANVNDFYHGWQSGHGLLRDRCPGAKNDKFDEHHTCITKSRTCITK